MTNPEGEGRERATWQSPWVVVAVLLLANITFWIDRQILALLVIPIRRDLGLTLTQTGYLLGLPFAIFTAVMAIPIARFADSSNRRNIIAAGIAIWSFMTALCGLAGTFSRLLLARIGVGVGESSLQPAATSLLADAFPPHRLGFGMGVYSMGSFLGSGMAYFIGGSIVGLVATQDAWQWPLIGTIRPWQTVFLFVGLPGLLVAALTLWLREPERRDRAPKPVPVRLLASYIGAHLRTFTSMSLGYAASFTVNIGISLWLATFLIQQYGWSAARAGMVQGVLTVVIGPIGVVGGGRLRDWYASRGSMDGALLVGIIGAIGMLVSATAYPFATSSTVVVVWLVLVNFFAALPWGAASAAVAEIVPARMRAQGVALYFVIVNSLAVAIGPIAVAAIAQHVFHDDKAIREGLAILNVVGMSIAIVFLSYGRAAFRRTISTRDDWKSE